MGYCVFDCNEILKVLWNGQAKNKGMMTYQGRVKVLLNQAFFIDDCFKSGFFLFLLLFKLHKTLKHPVMKTAYFSK